MFHKERCRIDIHGFRQRLQCVDGRRVFFALDHADIVAIKPGTVRELLLGQPPILPQPSQILSYDPPKFHDFDGNPSL